MKAFTRVARAGAGLALAVSWVGGAQAAGILIDHTKANPAYFASQPMAKYQLAKNQLHIAYGHTSHGSQLTDGMSSLVGFINGHGLGMNYPSNFFAWNNGGSGGALDLHDSAMGGDVGYYPQWVNNTRTYLNNPANSNVNVIIWSWCGQITSKYQNDTLNSEYLTPMSQLEAEYPNVTFVYMTGHLDHGSDAANKAANQTVRDYCRNNGKVLFDFADIESYNPDGTYFQYANDNCDYYASATSNTSLGNWATEWQNSHTQNVDWFSCSAAHSQALNGNQKAYGSWALWSEIAASQVPEPTSVVLMSLTGVMLLGRRRG